MKLFNIARYILSIVVPIAVCISYGWIWFLLVSFTLLYLNNVVDDVVFYYGSCFAKGERKRGAILSPVEGVVTKIDYNVPLYSHLYKNDILTKEELVEQSIKHKGEGYLHVAIFLNKFNKHAVANIFGTKSRIRQYAKDGEPAEMVCNGKLIADNEGEYLSNTFVDIAYDNGVHVVLTMDKYVSKAVLAKDYIDAELLICKGSQCDLYVPQEIIVGEAKVNINGSIRLLEEIVDCNEYICLSFDSECFRKTILECIDNSGFNFLKAIKNNGAKTASTITYNRLYLLIQMIVGVLYPVAFVYIFGVYIYVFCLVRYYKNIMYNLMNCIGYKEWMTTTYNKLNRLLNYGK